MNRVSGRLATGEVSKRTSPVERRWTVKPNGLMVVLCRVNTRSELEEEIERWRKFPINGWKTSAGDGCWRGVDAKNKLWKWRSTVSPFSGISSYVRTHLIALVAFRRDISRPIMYKGAIWMQLGSSSVHLQWIEDVIYRIED
nr:hypothetical protein Iba_chr09dCG13220 [Ipomoea batatas]